MNTTTDFLHLLKQPSAWLPMLMSFAALLLISVYLGMFGLQHNTSGDEGTAARLFQTLMLLQVPLVLYFMSRFIGSKPLPTLLIALLQTTLWLSAVITIYLLEN